MNEGFPTTGVSRGDFKYPKSGIKFGACWFLERPEPHWVQSGFRKNMTGIKSKRKTFIGCRGIKEAQLQVSESKV